MTTAHSFSGNAVSTTLNGSINNSTTTVVISDATGWPDGSSGPFTATIGAGTASEERLLVTSRSGTTLTVANRGYDSTTAASHSSGESIVHSLSAVDMRQAVLGTSGSYAKCSRSSLTIASSATSISWTTISSPDSIGGSPPQSSISLSRSGLYLVTFIAQTPSVPGVTAQLLVNGATTYAFPSGSLTAPASIHGAILLKDPTSVALQLGHSSGTATIASAEMTIAHLLPTS